MIAHHIPSTARRLLPDIRPDSPVVEIRADASLRAAQIAVLFGRRGGADCRTVDETARDAIKFVTLAIRARKALERGKSTNQYVLKLAQIAETYDATVIAFDDLQAAVIALRFRHGVCFTKWPLLVS